MDGTGVKKKTTETNYWGDLHDHIVILLHESSKLTGVRLQCLAH